MRLDDPLASEVDGPSPLGLGFSGTGRKRLTRTTSMTSPGATRRPHQCANRRASRHRAATSTGVRPRRNSRRFIEIGGRRGAEIETAAEQGHEAVVIGQEQRDVTVEPARQGEGRIDIATSSVVAMIRTPVGQARRRERLSSTALSLSCQRAEEREPRRHRGPQLRSGRSRAATQRGAASAAKALGNRPAPFGLAGGPATSRGPIRPLARRHRRKRGGLYRPDRRRGSHWRYHSTSSAPYGRREAPSRDCAPTRWLARMRSRVLVNAPVLNRNPAPLFSPSLLRPMSIVLAARLQARRPRAQRRSDPRPRRRAAPAARFRYAARLRSTGAF